MNHKEFKQIYKYIHHLFSKEDEILRSIPKSIRKAAMPQISILPNQGKFLQMLVTLINAKKILEIGTLAGYSTIWMARAMPDDGKLITIELKPKHAKIAKKNFETSGLSDKIEIRVGNAFDVFDQLDHEKIGIFDMVFIDAHKPDYVKYFEWVINHSHSGTIIVADNVIRGGRVLNQNSKNERVKGVQKFNQMLSERDDILATIIPNISGDGFDGIAFIVVK